MISLVLWCGDTRRDLAPRDISGTSDPFTRVIFNNHSAETSVSSVCMHEWVMWVALKSD